LAFPLAQIKVTSGSYNTPTTTPNMKARKKRLYTDTKFLTELRPFRNYLNKESLEKVVANIKKLMIESGLSVKEQNGAGYMGSHIHAITKII